MKTELISQYAHTWRIFEGIIKDFDEEAWIHVGCGTNTPARKAFHLLIGVKYYIEDSDTVLLASGKPFEGDWETLEAKDLPSPNDILICLEALKAKTESWLSKIDLEAENKTFPWAGKTKLGVILFLLRHNLYHIGELSSLLNESKNGVAKDHWVKTL